MQKKKTENRKNIYFSLHGKFEKGYAGKTHLINYKQPLSNRYTISPSV